MIQVSVGKKEVCTMENKQEERKENRRIVILSILGSAILLASILFFVFGLLAFSSAKNAPGEIIYIYTDEPFDPRGDQAEENAKVALVQMQKAFENKDQAAQRINFYLDIDEKTYMGEDIYAYEYQYVNDFGDQEYTELLYAEDDNYVRRFVNAGFVGYSYNKNGSAKEYIASKQHRLVLDAYSLDFESYSGANSTFTTSDASVNELYAFYTRTEYDENNLRLFHISLYNALNYVTITPDTSKPEEVDFLIFQPKSEPDHDVPGYWMYQNDKDRPQPNCSNYANIPNYLLPSDASYQKCYVQPKNGAYGNERGFWPTDDSRQEYIIGFVDTGNKIDEYITDVLLANSWVADGEYYSQETYGWVDGHDVTYKLLIKLSYLPASETPSFENGLMLVEHSRIIVG